MVDYVGLAIQSVFVGLGSGVGVIIAHEFYDHFKKYREMMKKGAKLVLNGVKTETDDIDKKKYF
jgi:hypothetical protein